MELDREERNRLLLLGDTALLELCRFDAFRGSGRGGRKQSTTDSAVRVTHRDTGIAATCSDTRSQNRNRTLALRRLRREIAFACRSAVPAGGWDGEWSPGRRSALYPVWLATVLDLLEAHAYQVRDTAAFFGLGTGRFVRDIAQDPQLWQQVNAGRRDAGLAPLRGK